MKEIRRSRRAQEWNKWYTTRRWARIRARQLKAEPYCQSPHCKGKYVEATIADHIEPHRGDSRKFWAGKLQSLCKPCHDGPKRSQEAGGHGFLRGSNERGEPLDPSHWWYS